MNKIFVILIAVVIYVISCYFSYSFFSPASSQVRSPITSYNAPANDTGEQIEDNEPKTEACPLNGGLYSKRQRELWEGRRPLGVMIENHLDARPQSGLSSADVIYEAVAEGGITRFLAIFYCRDASYIGPVRSARVYFVDLLSEYGSYPLYAHVGGANTPGPADALSKIKKLGWSLYNDLNQFAVPFPYFWRDYERLPDRVTEHTVYSATKQLWEYAATKRKLTNVDDDGVSWDGDFETWKFQEEKTNKVSPTVTTIAFDFWDNKPEYAVEWKYDGVKNTFLRSNGGIPHMDKNTNKQLEMSTLVIIFARESTANDGYEGEHLLYKLVGEGKAIIFQNGVSSKGSWSKEEASSRMKFFDTVGEEIEFVGGQIFFEILPEGNTVIY